MNSREIIYCNCGFIDYKEAWDLQKKIHAKRKERGISDVLLLLEHPHTYTLGKVAKREHLVGSDEYLKENEIKVYDIDRGGDITYHGPGQIVGYPIILLSEWKEDSHKYLRAIEEVIILTLREYGLSGARNEKYTGVWIEDSKIAAIGIKIANWITMHGFAFNINTLLQYFEGIIPCGITDKSVTSLNRELRCESVDIEEVKAILLNKFLSVFEYNNNKTIELQELIKLTS